MKLDLHCNLPYDSKIPNPALGYLKSYLSSNKNLNIRNIYWNLLPLELHSKYIRLVKEINKIFSDQKEFLICFHIARFLYEKKLEKLPDSTLRPLFDKPFFFDDEFKEFADDLKKHVKEYIKKKKLYDVDIAGFTMGTYQWVLNYYLILQLKKYNPNIKIVIGGLNSQSQAEEFMRVFKEIDFAIWAEGEKPLSILINKLRKPEEYKQINNLVFREKNKIITNKETHSDNLADLNNYPFADHKDYFKTLLEHNIYDFYNSIIRIPIRGARSCFWNKCKFCVLYQKGSYIEKTPENIVSEIEYQTQLYKTDKVTFLDADEGRKKRKSFDKLLNLLLKSSEKRKRPYQIFWELSPLRLDRKTIDMMKKITIESVQIGFEATSENLLRKMNKKQTFAHNIQALKFADEKDFSLISLNIIRGIPGETQEDVIESIKNLMFLRFFLNKYNFSLSELSLFKGSLFYNDFSEEERDNRWNKNYMFKEIEDLTLFKNIKKREFFGFNQDYLKNMNLWNVYTVCLRNYQNRDFRYNWYEYSDGSSLIEEGDKGIVLEPVETKLLSFCDTVKSFSEIKNKFQDIDEDELKNILIPLKEQGILYFRDDFKSFFISVLSTKYKKNF